MVSASDVTARVARLFVYPIKSCAGVEVAEAVLTPQGLEFDRAWMVVDERGEFLSQREIPQMALIQPTLRHHEMVVRAPGMLALHVALDEVEQPATVRVWGDEVAAYDMGRVAAQWFTDCLSGTWPAGRDDFLRRFGRLRLVRFDPDFTRRCDAAWTAGAAASTQFSDGFPVLVTTAAAVDDLNADLARQGLAPVGIERFRPNLVLAGLDAHAEDHLDWLASDTAAGEPQLKLVKPCVRCSIPDIDPMTARSDHWIGDYLRRQRSDNRMDGALTWGMNAIVCSVADQPIRVGQVWFGKYLFD